MLKIDGVSVAYGQVRVLENVSMRIGSGEIVALIGANGAGKTTLLRAISGLLRPAKGRILLNDQRIDGWPVDRIVREGIVQVPEGRDIFTKLTIKQNLLLGSYPIRPRRGIEQDMDAVFRYFPLLKDRQAQNGATLSGGMQQMLSIGRALMARPGILLLDEPSQGLAPQVTRTIFQILEQINTNGTTILLVEQNANKALKLSSSAYVMQNGRIALAGPSSELINNEMMKEYYLGSA